MNERRIQRELETRFVTIREVNAAQRYVEVHDQFGLSMRVSLRDNAPVTVVPYPGEVWTVSRSGVDWYLEHQIDNPTTIIKTEELQPGDRRIEAKGTIYIEGSSVVINGTTFAGGGGGNMGTIIALGGGL